jgi:ectoine hydroxylase-related dioxygenase (phytanoyl-CoA dioxygenase family)
MTAIDQMNWLSEQLDECGYVVLPDSVDRDLLGRLNGRIDELFAAEGEAAGSEFKQEPGSRRLANLVNKGDVFARVVTNARVLPFVAHVLGDYKLSSLNVRSVDPCSDVRQPLHADMGAIPDEQGFWVCNVVWMLQDITLKNGPLRVIPGTHLRKQLPQDVLTDPLADHPDQVMVTGRAGTIVVMNAHLWHGGLENQSPSPRTALHAFYCRRDKPQQQYQKVLVAEEVQSRLTPELRNLLALDDPKNDRISRCVKTTSGFMK